MNPTLPPAVVAQLEATFRAEAADRLREMHAAQKADGDAHERLATLFRHAHSIKGAAAAIGRDDVAELAHEFEGRLDAARKDEAELDDAEINAMLDDLAHVIDEVEGDEPGPHEAAAARPADDAPPADEPLPPASGVVDPAGPASSAKQPRVADVEEFVRVGAYGLDRIAADVGDLALTADEWRRLATATKGLAKRLSAAVRSASGGPEQQISSELAALSRRIREQTHRTDRLVGSVGEQLQAIRMEPLDALLETTAREARRLARRLEHTVDIVVEGGDVQADRSVIGRLRDPLLHLVRNAVDHGVDTTEERERSGKAASPTLRITARLHGNSLIIEVADDGRGIPVDRIRELARDRGVDVQHLDDAGVRGLIFTDGFSTAHEVTDVSGRGVGLAAVRDEIESLYGSVEVDSESGVGTTFRLVVPQGIAGVRCLVVAIGDRQLAVPVAGILTIRSFQNTAPQRVGGRSVLVFDGVARPLVPGAALVEGHTDTAARFGIVIVHAGRTCALAVDELVAQLDLVVKPLPAILGEVQGVSGAAVLGDGGLVPVLLPSALVELNTSMANLGLTADVAAAVVAPRLLVVDDSPTTCTLIRTILVAAGFEVETAPDGVEALQLLRAQSHDLVVSDIEMPRMDGFGLTRAIRADTNLGSIPVVLVSSRAEADDRAESAAAGADAHLDKGAFDQGQLVSVIRDLLG